MKIPTCRFCLLLWLTKDSLSDLQRNFDKLRCVLLIYIIFHLFTPLLCESQYYIISGIFQCFKMCHLTCSQFYLFLLYKNNLFVITSGTGCHNSKYYECLYFQAVWKTKYNELRRESFGKQIWTKRPAKYSNLTGCKDLISC